MLKSKTEKIVIIVGLLIFAIGVYLTGGLYPFKLQEVRGDALYSWWLNSLIRDLGAALMVITIVVSGLKIIRSKGRNTRRMFFLSAGYGIVVFFLILHVVAYVQSGKILQRIDFSDVIARLEEILENKDMPETKRRVLLHKLAENLYLQTGEQIEVITRDNNVVMFKPTKELSRFKKHNDLSRQLMSWMKFQSRNLLIMWLGIALLSSLFGLFVPLGFAVSGIMTKRSHEEEIDDFAEADASIDKDAAIDVLCVGHACYDLVFCVDNHPGADEKVFATAHMACGGGPAANAAVAVARLGCRSAFVGQLGNDVYGQKHLREFIHERVNIRYVSRFESQTPLSSILVKPNGHRTVVTFKGNAIPLLPDAFDFSNCQPRVILFDGHEPGISKFLAAYARKREIPSVLDAGSVHEGTRELVSQVDYLVSAWKFAHTFTGETDPEKALVKLCELAPAVVITLGKDGLIWRNEDGAGHLGVFPVDAVDTTGAGDAFHGAFAAGLVMGKSWPELLTYASAVAALTCSAHGSRLAIPDAQAVKKLLQESETVEPAKKNADNPD